MRVGLALSLSVRARSYVYLCVWVEALVVVAFVGIVAHALAFCACVYGRSLEFFFYVVVFLCLLLAGVRFCVRARLLPLPLVVRFVCGTFLCPAPQPLFFKFRLVTRFTPARGL